MLRKILKIFCDSLNEGQKHQSFSELPVIKRIKFLATLL